MDLEQCVKESAEIIASNIKKGNSIEIHPCKDGIRIMVVKKNVIK